MTLDAAIQKVTADIDRILSRRWDGMMEKMIADGVNPSSSSDNPGPYCDVGIGRPVTFDAALQMQVDIDLRWRAETLEKVRSLLTAEYAAGCNVA